MRKYLVMLAVAVFVFSALTHAQQPIQVVIQAPLQQKSFYDIAPFWIDVILALVGIAGVMAAWRTLRFLRRQSVEMIRQRVTMQHTLREIKRQADALDTQVADAKASNSAAAQTTKDTLEAMQRQAKEMSRQNKNMISRERARISIRIGELKLSDVVDGVLMATVDVEIFNYGATKAFIGINHAAFSISRSKEPWSTKYAGALTSQPVIDPTAEKPVGTTFRFIGDTGAGTIKALNLEELFPHIYGMVRYTDVFGQSVEIRFRYMWDANGWIVAAQQAGLTTVTAVETSIYGEWQKYGDEQDNYEGKPN